MYYSSVWFLTQSMTVFINYDITECVSNHNTTLLEYDRVKDRVWFETEPQNFGVTAERLVS